MTSEFAMEYVSRRMRELKYGDDYSLRFVHFTLNPSEIRAVEATHQLYILIDEPTKVAVDSDTGIYTPAPQYINQMQHEHQGAITLTNLDSGNVQSVRFIQVIPKTYHP